MPYTRPDGIGWQRTDTSQAAAHASVPHAHTLRAHVLSLLKIMGRPMSSEEVAEKLDQDYRSIQPRLSELREGGFVRDSGTRVRSSRGRNIIAWEVVPPTI